MTNRLNNSDIFWFLQNVVRITFNRYVNLSLLTVNTGVYTVDTYSGNVKFTLQFVYHEDAEEWYVRVFDSDENLISSVYLYGDDIQDKHQYISLINDTLLHIYEKMAKGAIGKALDYYKYL